MVRAFLDYAAKHSVEDVQAYTSQVIPVPRWVHRLAVSIPSSCSERSEAILEAHLREYYGGQAGVDEIGGLAWTRVRGRGLEVRELSDFIESSARRAWRLVRAAVSIAAVAHVAKGEWIEMRKDSMRRAAAKVHQASEELRTGIRDSSGADVKTDRVVLYVHGGAFVRGTAPTRADRAVLLEPRDASLSDPAACAQARRAGVRCRISSGAAMYVASRPSRLTTQTRSPARSSTSWRASLLTLSGR